MQIKESELHLLRRAVIYYRDHVIGHEDLVDEMDKLLIKLKSYQDNYSVD